MLRIINETVDRQRNDRLRLERSRGTERLLRNGSEPRHQAEQQSTPSPALGAPGPPGPSLARPRSNPPRAQPQQTGAPDPASVCWYHNHGGCHRVVCQFEHRLVKADKKHLIPMPRYAGGQPEEDPKGQPAAMDKGKGKGKGKQGDLRSRQEPKGNEKGKGDGRRGGKGQQAPPVMCMTFLSTGSCKWGENCFNLHADGGEDVARAQAARAAREASRVAAEQS